MLSKIKKDMKGITLIALIITIIVLLILAGVSIATLTGQNGILKNAGKAREQTIVEQEKEDIKVAYNGVIASNGIKDVSKSELQAELENNGHNVEVTYNEDGELNIFFKDTQNNYKIKDGRVEEAVLTEKRMNLQKGVIETVDIQTNKIIDEEKVAIIKTKPGFSKTTTEVYFVDSGENNPQQYLKDEYGITEDSIVEVSYNDNCLPVYKGNVGTIYYVASQGNTYLNNEESGGGYMMFGGIAGKLDGKINLKKIDFTNLNTKYAVNMQSMFRFAGQAVDETKGEYLEIVYGPNFDTSNVKTMEDMYRDANMKQIILPEKFNTINVTNMRYMFNQQSLHDISVLEIIDLGENFDTSNVTDMSGMFMVTGINKLKVLDLGDKFDTSNVIEMGLMLNSCGKKSLETLNLGGKFVISSSKVDYLVFADCGTENLKEIIYEDTMENFEEKCSALIPLINKNRYKNGKPIIKCTDGNYEY